jgi:hypothetical protein
LTPSTLGRSNCTLAFSAEPSHRAYRLRLARYKAMAETVAQYLRERDAS